MDINPDDPRLVFLRKAPTKNLVSILNESMSDELGMSFNYLILGMNPLFRETLPNTMRVLISKIIIERNGE